MQWRPLTLGVAFAALSGLAVYGCCGLTRHTIVALDKWGDAAPALTASAQHTAAGVDAGLAAINRPCRKDVPCGTLAALDKAIVKAGDAIVTTQLEERRIPGEIETTLAAYQSVPIHVDRTLDAATNVTNRLATDADTLNQDFAAAQPLLASYTAAGNSLNDLLKQRAIILTLDNMQAMTGNGNSILADARKVADKTTADYLKPVPWWKQPIKKSSDLLDIGALFARHAP
jgi:hypothetical protein